VALFNKGEANRLLHNDDLSLRIFKRIIEINEDKILVKKFSSDYYSSLLRMASILIDQARGKEAINLLNKLVVPEDGTRNILKNDTRFGMRDLELASAFIDQKEFISAGDSHQNKNAFDILMTFDVINDKHKYTFAQRKAIVYWLRFLIEFKKNQSEKFNNPEKDVIQTIKSEYGKFENKARELLKQCIERYDGDLFKKTCTYLADYFHEKSECSKKDRDKDGVLVNRIKELGYYYLYLCNKAILDEKGKLRKKIKYEKIINDWILVDHIDQKQLENIVVQYDVFVKFMEGFDEVDDERYLKGFFETYFNICMENNFIPNDKEKEIIKKMTDRSVDVYQEKDNLIELGEVQEKYSRLKEKINQAKNTNEKTGSEDFIRKYFFNVSKNDKKTTFLYPDVTRN
jgi:hypothetical protein